MLLANCSHCGTEATLFFSAGPVCSSFFAEACAIMQAICWSRQHQQACHFSSTIGLSFCPLPPSFFYVNLFDRNYLFSSPVLSGYNGSPDTRFSRGTTRLMSRPDGERYSLHLQFLVVSYFFWYPLFFFGLEAYCLI